MDNYQKSQFLHKVIAGSAFVFSLCILPVAQHFLVTNQLTTSSTNQANLVPAENGTVAGASTDQSIVQPIASLVSPQPTEVACQTDQARSQQLQDIDKVLGEQEKFLGSQYLKNTDQYSKQLAALPETTANKRNIEGLKLLINAEFTRYTDRLAHVREVLDSQKKSLEAAPSCPKE